MCERRIVVKIVHRITKISDIMFSVTGTHAACQTVSRKIEVQSLPAIEPNAVPNASDHVVGNQSRLTVPCASQPRGENSTLTGRAMMNAQRGISVCGAEGHICNKETDTLLPLPQQNWSRPYSHNFNTEASLNFDSEQCAYSEQNDPTQCLKRSPSFLIALSDSAVFFKPNDNAAPSAEEAPNSSASPDTPPPGNTRLQKNQKAHALTQQNSSSSLNSGTSDERLCRICHEAEDNEELVSPCYCSGSVGLLHLTCLERWLGTSKLTRCEICKYEFTLKRLPRALTEFLQDPPSIKHRNNLLCDLACFVVLTPVTVSSAYLCGSGVQRYAQRPDSWQVQGLSALTVCLVFVYFTWLIVAISHHYGICKKWREENQVVKITYIYPVKSKRTLHSPSIASSKFDILNSSRGSVAAWGTVSDRENPPHPSLATTPLLRPILRYSAQLKASSWHSGLSECAVNLGLPPYHSTANTRRTSAGDRGQSVFHMRQETYV